MTEILKGRKVEVFFYFVGVIFFVIAGIKTLLMGFDFSEFSVERMHDVFNIAGVGTLFVVIAFGVHLLKKRKDN